MSNTHDCFLSIILPVHNGACFIKRAVESVRSQGFGRWELLAVDDASTDASWDLLVGLAAQEPRLRLLRRQLNGGVAAARNTALLQARGEWVAYLDVDDEFHPDHFQHIFDLRERGDVLIFQYDLLEERPGFAHFGELVTWNPRLVFDRLMHEHITVPLGVAHRRVLMERSGPFDETPNLDEDTELWQRFARAGATFHLPPHKSGIYHVRSDSLSRTRAGLPRLIAPSKSANLPGRLEVQHERGRVVLQVQKHDSVAATDVFEGHEYGGVPQQLLRKPPVMLDVGANVGAFAIYAKLSYHPQAIVHCFEPSPTTVELLQKNIAPFPGIHLHALALGNRDGEVALLLHDSFTVCNSLVPELVPTPTGHLNVPLRDAGGYWDHLGLGEVDILKLDAEGSEVPILESLGPRLPCVRFVLVEFHSRQDRRRIDALLSGFELFGVKLYSCDVGVLKYARADLVKPR